MRVKGRAESLRRVAEVIRFTIERNGLRLVCDQRTEGEFEMRFTAFYFLAGAMFAAGAIKTTAETPGMAALFVGSIVACVIGAIFEACNPNA